MWQLDLTQPGFLAGLVLVPVLAWYFARSLVDFPRWQRLLSLAVRAALLVLLALALAGLTALEPTREQFVVFVVDQSQSVGKEGRQAAEEFMDRALAHRGPHQVAFLSFAAEPGLVTAQRPRADGPPPEDDEAGLGTNLAAAIEAAAAAAPPGRVPHLVVLSDGNETAGNALQAALRAGVPVSTVPLPARADPEVQVSEVVVPDHEVNEGESFPIEVVVHSNHDDEGILELWNGRQPVPGVREQRRKIGKGETRFRFEQALTRERLAIFQAHFRAFRDTLEENNSARGLVFCAGKPRVLIVDGDPKQAGHLARALEEQGIQVDPPRPSQGMPDSLADLQQYELLILSNVPATKLTQKQMGLVRTYVQELGGGFLMLGGDQSFGLGGYSRSVLEDILPVHSDFKKDKEKPSLAMVLVIDRSGSMQGQKMDMTRDAAIAAVELLGPNDKVGVITFDTETHWTSELRPCADKGSVIDRIRHIEAAGGTRIYPALEEAYKALREAGASAKFKHVILLTDGIDNSAGAGEFLELVGRMAAARITVTTVAVGTDADKNLLGRMAQAGNGRFYPAEDPASVPQIFAKETVAAGGQGLQERSFAPVRFRPTPVLAGLDWKDPPLLHGSVLTRAKATGELILMTDKGDPLLAWWRSGLGMSVAFTSDAKLKWADEWITNQPEFYAKFWAQVARHAMRKSEARGAEVKVARQGGRATVTLDATDPAGQFLNLCGAGSGAELTVIGPRSAPRTLPMPQVAPGRFRADFDASAGGEYHLQVTAKQDGEVVLQQSRGLAVGYPDELRLRPPDEALLEAVARVSGGKYRPAPEGVFAPPDRVARRVTPLWPSLTAAAAVLFFLDVVLRRIDLALLWGGVRRRFSVALAQPAK
jgi:Mg-chelatase subunit ChlD